MDYMESIFDDLDSDRIAPQNFRLAIAMALACIVVSSIYCFPGQRYNHFIYFFENILWLYLQFFFRTYLQNFRAVQAIKWTKWSIVLSIAALFAALIAYGNPHMVATHLVSEVSPLIKALASMIFAALLLPLIILTVGLGIALQKIKNDFVGLLRGYGIVLALLTPVAGVWSVVFLFPNGARKLFSFCPALPDIIGVVINMVPVAIILVIYYRALKYQQKGAPNTFRNEY